MTAHPYVPSRLVSRPAEDTSDGDLDPTLVDALERTDLELPINRTPLRRLVARRLVHRCAAEALGRPMVANLTPKGRATIDRVYARRSLLTLTLLRSDP